MHARRTSSSVQELGETHSSSGSPWSRQGGAVCSIALLLLGGALVIYGGALMTVGHQPLREGQAEQWQRIARIRLHQARQDSVAAVDKALEQSKQQVVQSESELEPEVPLSKHAAAKVRQVFESIISSEELPRQTGSMGSLSDHLNSSDKAGKDWPAMSMLVEGLQQIKAAHSATTQHRKLTLAGRWTPDDAAI